MTFEKERDDDLDPRLQYPITCTNFKSMKATIAGLPKKFNNDLD